LTIIDDRGREAARYQIVYGAHILVEDGSRVVQDQLLATWDPFTFAILTEVAGHVKFQDLKEGVTFDEEVDEVTGQSRMVVKDSPDEKKQPRLKFATPAQGAEDISNAGARKLDGDRRRGGRAW